jgi:hypothetical protein
MCQNAIKGLPHYTLVDQAGNAWAANNWNDIDAVIANEEPPRDITTWGGDTGISVIYGVASPVKALAS